MQDVVHIIQVVKHSTIDRTGDRITFSTYDADLPDWDPDPVVVSEEAVKTTMRDVQSLPLFNGETVHVCIADDNTEKLLQSVIAHVSRLTRMYTHTDQEYRFYRSKFIEADGDRKRYKKDRDYYSTQLTKARTAGLFTRLKWVFTGVNP